MKKALVISSHLDDAVLSAGQFLAGRPDCDVLTVFSGIPKNKELLTPYDKSCGFDTSEDAMITRLRENEEALALLRARPLYVGRLDSQYKKSHYKLSTALQDWIEAESYEIVVGPLGLQHPDHIAIANALGSLELPNLYLYEDLPHRVTHPELVPVRLKQFPKAQLKFIGDGDIALKVRALWCYRSQMLRGDLNPYNLYVGERFWKI